MIDKPNWNANDLLHQSRGALLRDMPAGAQRFISVGCSGVWYFDWIQKTYGYVEQHVGIEYYLPRPEDLPSNVTWIQNTASNLSSIESSSADLVFSGQNLEHLWPEETCGFFMESARVLKSGGTLVVDSPNREITGLLNWSHPEHTVELTCAEAVKLFELAGFEVTKVKGIWLCRDPKSARVLPFDPNIPDDEWSVTERLIAAIDRPAEAFIWWIEGKRSNRAPDRAGIRSSMDDIFRSAWAERMQRSTIAAGRQTIVDERGEWVIADSQTAGMLLYGPYVPLRKGRYRCVWHFRTHSTTVGAYAVCDVVAAGGTNPIASRQTQSGETTVSIDFDLPVQTFGIEFRCYSLGQERFEVLRRVDLAERS